MATDLDADVQTIAAKQSTIKQYRDYYEGRHRLAFATQKFINAFGPLFQKFADNLMPACIDAVSDRLEVEGFEVEDGAASLEDAAWKLWTANRMDRRAGEAYAEALLTGDSYLIAWPDDSGALRFYPNRSDLVCVTYDPEGSGNIVRAAKLWLADGKARCNLYYPDRTERYVTAQSTATLPDRAGGFVEFGPAVDNPWDTVPVFHLANNAPIGGCGRSELADVIPLQDALNKTNADRLVAGEFLALPQRYAIGIEPTFDPETGQPVPMFQPGADRIWQTGSPDAKFGQFAAADLSRLREEATDWRLEIARVSGVPLHYLMLQSGDFPSGEAQRVAETRFLGKIKDRQASYGTAWSDLMAFALRASGAGTVTVAPRWQDPSPHGELEHAQTLALKQQLGVSQQQLLRELGYSDQQIDQMMQERQATDQQFGSALLTQFERGSESTAVGLPIKPGQPAQPGQQQGATNASA